MTRPAYDADNPFAKILRGELPCQKVFENEHALAFHDIRPQAPAHVLVIPKGAYVDMDDFSLHAGEAEVAGLFRAVADTARKLGLVEPGYRVLANLGRDARQEVFHFHIHIFGGRDLGGMIRRPD
jgi:diadenosine tetraphosphate (Ap4A) HIT family hydrolase